MIDPTAFIAPGAIVLGDVHLGAESSVWYNAVLRGDTDRITIGARTNIQDLTMIHADPGVPCTVGERVTVGHRVILHGCTIEDDCLIGMGAIILNGARVGRGSVIGAGALVRENAEIAPGSLVVGVPAKEIRPVERGDGEPPRTRLAALRRAGPTPPRGNLSDPAADGRLARVYHVERRVAGRSRLLQVTRSHIVARRSRHRPPIRAFPLARTVRDADEGRAMLHFRQRRIHNKDGEGRPEWEEDGRRVSGVVVDPSRHCETAKGEACRKLPSLWRAMPRNSPSSAVATSTSGRSGTLSG